MDLMKRRREILAQGGKIDTSPVITQTGVCWNRTIGSTTENASWGITKWYAVDDQPQSITRSIPINGFVGADSSNITFQYNCTAKQDYWYFSGTNPRRAAIPAEQRMVDISFSIELSQIDNSYAYIEDTGQILFAGKNTQYYGHRNISELSE